MATRKTTERDKHRRQIAATNSPCAICGLPIDYNIAYPDPMSFVVDHIVPLSRGGTDAIGNKQAAHRTCNRDKSDKTDGGSIMRRSGSLHGL